MFDKRSLFTEPEVSYYTMLVSESLATETVASDAVSLAAQVIMVQISMSPISHPPPSVPKAQPAVQNGGLLLLLNASEG